MLIKSTKLVLSHLLLLSSLHCHAFITNDIPRQLVTTHQHPSSTTLHSHQTRRAFALTVLTTTTSLPLITQPANAAVFADPDRYGDKELKIATVNKLRQNVRDAILKNPALGPLFLKVAILDGLTYDANSGTGGPDGSIIYAILAPDAAAPLMPLRPAAQKLAEIANRVKKQTEVTLADIVGFAGAEAIETAGGPRIVVQLGKMDPKTPSAPAGAGGYPDLCGTGSGTDVVAAFLKSGLSEREVAILYGALADMESISSKFVVEEEDEEENEMGDKAVFIPSSFGAPSEIYGQLMGKMTGGVFKDIAKDLKAKKKPIAGVFLDEKVGGWAMKYAQNPGGFLKDLPEAYSKVNGLGLRYTGGKVGALLGGADPTL